MPRVTRRRAAALALLVTAVAFLVPLFSGSARALGRAPFAAPPPARRFAGWAEVFRDAPRVELFSLDTGAVEVARAAMLGPTDPGAASYPGGEAPLRVFAHLIRHPTQGDLLIDSGLDRSFAGDRYGNIARPARWILALLLDAPYAQRPGEAIEDRLEALGARPHTLLLTHLHMDHTAGIPALGARGLAHVVTGPGEADDVYQVFGFGHLGGVPRLEELDFDGAPILAPLGPAIDVLGDGSLWAVSTPGHSVGHVSFVVNATSGPVLLTGDATHFRWAFEHGVGPAAPSPAEEATARESLARLRAFAAAHPEVVVFTGHEAPR